MIAPVYNDRWSLSSGLYFYGSWTDSAFRPYQIDFIEDVVDWLGLVTNDAVMMEWGPEDDPDWIMDCQDYHDVELLLDFSGNLDAPL